MKISKRLESKVFYSTSDQGNMWYVSALYPTAFGNIIGNSSRIYDKFSQDHAALPILKKEALLALDAQLNNMHKTLSFILEK